MTPLGQARLGLLTDLHYDGGGAAMNRLYESIAALNAGGVEALVLMGDLANGNSPLHAKRLLREVSALCDVFRGEIRFMPGNHDLDHLSKAEFFNAVGRAGDPARFHFEFGGHEFIGLDGNFSPDGNDYDRGNFDWSEAFVPDEQLDWFRGHLGASLLPVVVICHQRIDKETRFAVRNHAAVRDMISLSGKVVAVFQGHNHKDDLLQLDGATYYTLAAGVDGAGPAVVELATKGLRLLRDFTPA